MFETFKIYYIKLLLLLLLMMSICDAIEVEEVFSWKTPTFKWVNDSQRVDYIQNGKYKVRNCIITGVKVYKKKFYVSVPRWKSGVPITLAVVDSNGLLIPFPSWEMNDHTNASALQNIQSFEITPDGILWILDVGRRAFYDDDISTHYNGPAKIIQYDLNSNKEISRYLFPNSVSKFDASFLNDLVIDYSRKWVYISDAGLGGIIAYDSNRNIAARFDGKSTKIEADVDFVINNIDYGKNNFTTPTDGIALSPDTKYLYYCSLHALHLWKIETDILRNFDHNNFDKKSINLGKKLSPSDGLAITSTGQLYYGGLTTASFYTWNIVNNYQSKVSTNDKKYQWIDTFGFDDNDLIFSTNRLQRFFAGPALNLSETNIYIFRVKNVGGSYMKNQQPPTPQKQKKCNTAQVSIIVGVFSVLIGAVVVMLAMYFNDRMKQGKTAEVANNNMLSPLINVDIEPMSD